jgi:multicomponent Na+:H+ antiporter subunit G
VTLALDIASWALILAGSFFTVVGALGLVRMPDIFTRMHAVGLIDSLGVSLLILGMLLQAGLGLVTFKLLFLLALVFFTWPVVTHALAQVCIHEGVQPLLVEDRDDLARRRRHQQQAGSDQGGQPSN